MVVFIIAVAHNCTVRLAQSPWSQLAQCHLETVKNSVQSFAANIFALNQGCMHFQEQSCTASLYIMLVLRCHVMAAMPPLFNADHCMLITSFAHWLRTSRSRVLQSNQGAVGADKCIFKRATFCRGRPHLLQCNRIPDTSQALDRRTRWTVSM